MRQFLNQWMNRLASRKPIAMPTRYCLTLLECLESRQLMSAGGFDSGMMGEGHDGAIHAKAFHNSERQHGERQRQVTYSIGVIAKALSRPTGIAIGKDGAVIYTQVPTPGVGGGQNSVSKLNEDGTTTVLHIGEPEPTNIATSRDGTIYWTCKSAGVILEQKPDGTTTKLLTGLTKPTGIAIDPSGENVYFTQVPTPGVKGADGGTNTVSKLNIATGTVTVLHTGDPEPTDIAVDRDGNVYWTCKSAGVIVEQTAAGVTSVVLKGLHSPTGIAVDKSGRNLYFTEVPTPGVKGVDGGTNTVNRLELRSMTRTIIHSGDPEPQDVAVDRQGNVYWTCRTAGVIVEAKRTDFGHNDDSDNQENGE